MREFLEALINVSEKAANIARQCRQERALFELLVQEKTGNQKNKRFLQDFKTLGDVLIQETVKHDIGRKFPDIAERIFGEESNKFTNTKGETIRVDVKNTEEETCELLAKVLDGNMEAACLLAVAVHKEVRMKVDLNNVTIQLPLKDLGVWIDPIDSTAEYISGDCGVKAVNGIHPVGLQCVTVLIGVFDWATGVPVLGVINQPFHKLSAEDDSWRGRFLWGISYNGSRLSYNGERPAEAAAGEDAHAVIMSTTEPASVQGALASTRRVYASGAGYKQLCVIDALVNTYVLTRGSTFNWDTCAPHAILRALGGGVVDLQRALADDSGDLRRSQLTYNEPDKRQEGINQWCHLGGLVAYSSEEKCREVLGMLKKV